MEHITAKLQSEGFITLTPLNPGHGLLKDDKNCALPHADCILNTPAGFLPTSPKQYIEYASWAVAMIREEIAMIPDENKAPDFVVNTMGLSLGGSLTIIAASQAPDLFNRTLSVNGLFGLQETGLDMQRLKCQASPNPLQCMQDVVAKIVGVDTKVEAGENVSSARPEEKKVARTFPFNLSKMIAWAFENAQKVFKTFLKDTIASVLLNHYSKFWHLAGIASTNMVDGGVGTWIGGGITGQPFGWGQQCYENVQRPGYCIFRIKNMFAVSAVGMYALSRAPRLPPHISLGVVTAERDGNGRNGLALSMAKISAIRHTNTQQGGSTSLCIFLATPNCDLLDPNLGNTCGMPHSCFARSESLNTIPHRMDWEAELFDNVVRFMRDGKPVGSVQPDTSAEKVKDYCMPVPLREVQGFGGVAPFSGAAPLESHFSVEHETMEWSWKTYRD
ncbi:hypothetical protein HK102_011633 [Quaeritorhiza haematococci]|nr:hypothetical protein HK102_011633 [Quaeritorhiza haematococci]